MLGIYETDLIIPDPAFGISVWQSPTGIAIQITTAFVVGILIGLWLGRRSGKREPLS